MSTQPETERPEGWIAPTVETPPDDDDGDDAPDPETPAEPAPSAEDQMKAQNEVRKQLDKEDARHTKRYAEIMGETVTSLIPCPLCWRPGFIFPPGEMEPQTEVQAVLLNTLTQGAATQLETANDTKPCDACNGYGVVITGSKAPGHETKNCSSCGGIGWLSKPIAVPEQPQAQPVAWTPPPNPAWSPQTLGGDRWNRAPGHPDYGLDPAQIVSR